MNDLAYIFSSGPTPRSEYRDDISHYRECEDANASDWGDGCICDLLELEAEIVREIMDGPSDEEIKAMTK